MIIPPLPPGCMTTVWGDDARFVKTYFSTFPKRACLLDVRLGDPRCGRLLLRAGPHRRRDQRGGPSARHARDRGGGAGASGHRRGRGRGRRRSAEGADPGGVRRRQGSRRPWPRPAAIAKMRKEVMDTVDRELGAIARPGAVHFVTVLPKTRSGKLLRRTIQALAEGRDPGDLTTIEDPAALEQIRRGAGGRIGEVAARLRPRPAGTTQAAGWAIICGLTAAAHARLPVAATASPRPRRHRRRPARAARRRHPRRRRRQHSLRIDRRRRSRGQPAVRGGRPVFPDDDAQRAEAVPGDAVRRGRGRSSASASRRRRWRCCARAIRASRATSRRWPTCWRERATSPGDLQCGTHAPGFYEVRGEVPPPPPYSPLAHNCSGKHSGMLAYCVHCGLPKESYLAVRPSAAAGDPARGRAFHVDAGGRARRRHRRLLGAELRGAARRAWRWPSRGLPRRRTMPCTARAPRVLADAMTAHPEMVSGERRTDLALTRAGRGDWVAKIGAEGVQAIGLRGAGIGIAIKVADGNKRALRPVDRIGARAAGAAGRGSPRRARGVVRADRAQLPRHRDRTDSSPRLSWTKCRSPSTGRRATPNDPTRA